MGHLSQNSIPDPPDPRKVKSASISKETKKRLSEFPQSDSNVTPKVAVWSQKWESLLSRFGGNPESHYLVTIESLSLFRAQGVLGVPRITTLIIKWVRIACSVHWERNSQVGVYILSGTVCS